MKRPPVHKAETSQNPGPLRVGFLRPGRVAALLWSVGMLLAGLWVGLWVWMARTHEPATASRPLVWVYVVEGGTRVYGPTAVPAGTRPEALLRRWGLQARGGLWLNGQPWDPAWPLPQAEVLVLELRPLRPRAADRVAVGRYSPTWLRRYGWAAAAPARFAQAQVRFPEGTTPLEADATFVGEALAQYGLAPQGLDRLTQETAPWPPENPPQLARIQEAIELRRKTVPYTVEYQALPQEPIDTLRVVQEGRPGVQVQAELVRYVNGREAERQTLGTWTLQAPQPRLVGYGTKITIQTLDTPDGPIRYWRAVRVYATSYSPCRVRPGGPCDDITASGRRLQKGIIAVRLSWYRYMKGLQVYVPGYGFGVIADVGGGIPGRPWIDLGYSEDDYQPWHRWVTMYFLAPPPPPEQILWILP